MEHYAAIDVSLEWSSVGVVDAAGQIVREAKVRSEREALAAFFTESGLAFARIGLEAGPLSQWLRAGLVEAGLPAILIETRHVKAALKAMTVKADRSCGSPPSRTCCSKRCAASACATRSSPTPPAVRSA